MILVALPSKPFTYTAKSTVRRQAVISDYEPEIDALFTAVKETAQIEIQPPSKWTDEETSRFVGEVVNSVLKKQLKHTDDIFLHGGDRCVEHVGNNSYPQSLSHFILVQFGSNQSPSNLDSQHPPSCSSHNRTHRDSVNS